MHPNSLSADIDAAAEAEEDIEDDEEEVARSKLSQPPPVSSLSPYVSYSVMLSPTYRVPVLYFTLRNLPSGFSPTSLDTVYRFLVPPAFQHAVSNVGVMGAISMGVSIPTIPASRLWA